MIKEPTNQNMKLMGLHWVTLLALFLVPTGITKAVAEEAQGMDGFQGGAALFLDPADLAPVASLKKRVPNSLIHICVQDQKRVDRLRVRLHEADLRGDVSVSLYDGESIPLVPNFVNLLVGGTESRVPSAEVMRVLAPLGAAIIADDVVTKPRSDETDEWPQYFYDASGNAVSNDVAIRPPLFHSQWTGGPRWSRHHDTMSSVSACVSGDGKVFYIFDEGSPFSPLLPSAWKVIARDAFNGTILWKREIDRWIPNLHSLKSGPANIPRRIVVVGKTLYVTLGIEAPVSALDTATGETLKVLEGTAQTEEIVYENGKLYLVADHLEEKPEIADPPRYGAKNWAQREKEVICFDLAADRSVWRRSSPWVAPLTLAVLGDRVFWFNGRQIVASDKQTGQELWASDELKGRDWAVGSAPKLLVQDGVVVFTMEVAGQRGTVSGFSADDGSLLWKAPSPASGYRSPKDLFVIDGKAWAGDVTNHRWSNDDSDATGEFTGVNIKTGDVDNRFPHVEAYWFHHRCHPGKATRNYVILNRSGTEFVNPRTGEWSLHHWTRGACLYGVMPANGMLYLPQHPCACYIGAKTYGFTTLSPKDANHATTRLTPEEKRLTTYRTQPLENAADATSDQWPTYRADFKRSGRLSGISPPTHQRWDLQLDGELTPPVIAEGKLLVSLKDKNTLVAVDANKGNIAWTFLPGGKIDSPPTVYKKRVYCGAADGFVYCLDINDGSLFWKFQASPTPTKHMWFERIEATHPVHGNVLVMNDRAYVVAGRNMFTDGGIRFLILDAASGKKISENIMDDRMPDSDEPMQMHHEFLNMPMASSDLLSTNGKKVFMRYQQFDLNGKRIKLDYTRKLYGTNREDIATSAEAAMSDQKGEDAHLFAGTGFLDDSWWHRTYWIFGKHHASGWPGYYVAGKGGAPAGRMITFDDQHIFTWGRLAKYFRWSKTYEYYLHAKDYDYNETWGSRLPILARSMLLSDGKLYILGPQELERQEYVNRQITTDAMQETMQGQLQALNGKRGSKLLVVDATNGKILSGTDMDSVPVFDGMAGAYGNVYVSMLDGTLRCLGQAGKSLERIPESRISQYNADAVVVNQPAGAKQPKPKRKRRKS